MVALHYVQRAWADPAVHKRPCILFHDGASHTIAKHLEPIPDLAGVHRPNQKKGNADLFILRDPMVLFPHAPDTCVPLSVDWTKSGIRRAAVETKLSHFLTLASAPQGRVCGSSSCRPVPRNTVETSCECPGPVTSEVVLPIFCLDGKELAPVLGNHRSAANQPFFSLPVDFKAGHCPFHATQLTATMLRDPLLLENYYITAYIQQ